jgi:hypothetical protein
METVARRRLVYPFWRLNPNDEKVGGLQGQGVKGKAVIYYRNSLKTLDLKTSGFPVG